MPVPDYADPRPARVQIADDLRRQIASGTYSPGDKLPPIREMARQYHVVTGTVQAALGVLRAGGLIQTRGTRGTYVLRAPEEQPSSEYEAVMGRIDRLSEEVRQLRGEVAALRQAKAAG